MDAPITYDAVTTADDLICAVLRGAMPPWPWNSDPAATDEFFQRNHLHGTAALLHSQMHASDWPRPVLDRLREAAVSQAMWELRHQQILVSALAALAESGVRAILIKGTALAYSLYADAGLRTRGDTDLLIAHEQKEHAHRVLLVNGLERALGISGEFVSYQASYAQRTASGSTHSLDVHWQINNSEVLSQLFTHEELARDAEALPSLSPEAWGASRVHGLLLACMHRATHKQNPYHVGGEAHHTADRLIWLYDVALLSQRLTSSEWERFSQLAMAKGLRAVCLDAMTLTREKLGTEFPPKVLAGLAAGGPPEKPALYLSGGKLRQQWMDFLALGTAARQARFLRELFFPPVKFMLRNQPQRSRVWLPWLYLSRAVGGVAKALRSRPRT